MIGFSIAIRPKSFEEEFQNLLPSPLRDTGIAARNVRVYYITHAEQRAMEWRMLKYTLFVQRLGCFPDSIRREWAQVTQHRMNVLLGFISPRAIEMAQGSLYLRNDKVGSLRDPGELRLVATWCIRKF